MIVRLKGISSSDRPIKRPKQQCSQLSSVYFNNQSKSKLNLTCLNQTEERALAGGCIVARHDFCAGGAGQMQPVATKPFVVSWF